MGLSVSHLAALRNLQLVCATSLNTATKELQYNLHESRLPPKLKSLGISFPVKFEDGRDLEFKGDPDLLFYGYDFQAIEDFLLQSKFDQLASLSLSPKVHLADLHEKYVPDRTAFLESCRCFLLQHFPLLTGRRSPPFDVLFEGDAPFWR